MRGAGRRAPAGARGAAAACRAATVEKPAAAAAKPQPAPPAAEGGGLLSYRPGKVGENRGRGGRAGAEIGGNAGSPGSHVTRATPEARAEAGFGPPAAEGVLA